MTIDKRAYKLANLVLDYSIGLRKDDRLLIQFDPEYIHYATIIGCEARKKGAKIQYDSITYAPDILRGFIKRRNLQEWGEELERRKSLAKWCNAEILIDCDSNPAYAEGVEDSEKRVAEFDKRVTTPYYEVLYRSGRQRGYAVRWSLVCFPCEKSAEYAEIPFDEYKELVYRATLGQDWMKMREDMEDKSNIFNNAGDVHIVVPGLTDLHLSLSGRGAEISDGRFNMPDGEIAYGPVEESANGFIYFQCPSKKSGFGVIGGIRLVFQDGIVTEYSARKNLKALEESLKINGAKRIGELGIGFNTGIGKITLETILDEKIAGTIHLAMGESFLEQSILEGGGLNKSDIHWDIVCDLRRDEGNLRKFPGGSIYVDGELVQQNGFWVI